MKIEKVCVRCKEPCIYSMCADCKKKLGDKVRARWADKNSRGRYIRGLNNAKTTIFCNENGYCIDMRL